MNKVTENIVKYSLEDESFIPFCKDAVSSFGCLVRKVSCPESEDSIQHVPFTLFPSPFPKKCFEDSLAIQQDLQLVMHKISHNHQFLWECLESVIKVDEYTRKLWEIYDIVHKEGFQQPVCLAMIRADYMLNTHEDEDVSEQYSRVPSDAALKQVEINTMSASFGGIAQQLHSYYKLIAGKMFGTKHVSKIPINSSCDCLAEGLFTAWKQYGNPNAVILFLVYDVERNIYDQRCLEVSVMKLESRVKIVRKSMIYLQEAAMIDGDRKLWVDGSEVAVVYQRSLYKPSDFVDEDSWKCRLMMERSKAILCPNAGYHLAGTKKVQQVLSKPGVLEKFVENKEIRERIRKTFMGMYSLDKNADGDKAIDCAIKNTGKYVLKPQREGGGNNVYGPNIATMLTAIKGSDERLSFILMERINPMVVQNVPVVANSDVPPQLSLMVSELGVFGVIVGTEKEIILNKQGGYLLRTKKVGTDEGGVATGYSVLDSPYLVD